MGVNGIAETFPCKTGKNNAGTRHKAVSALSAPGISPAGMLAFGAARFETTGLRYGWGVAGRKTIAKRAIKLHLPVLVQIFPVSMFVRLGLGFGLCCRGHGFAPSRHWAN